MAESKKLTDEDTASLMGRIADLSGAGLPLVSGLRALGEEAPAGPLRSSMLELAGSLESGGTLEEAIARQEGRIPPHLLGLIRAGLDTGRLGELLGRFAAYSSTGTDIRRRIYLSLAYPLISVTVASTIFIFVVAMLVPKFESIFRDFGMPVPAVTRFLFEISHATQRLWPSFLGLCALGVVAWMISRFAGTSLGGGLIGRLPILGGVWRSASLAEYFHLLALLIEGNVPLSRAVGLAGDGVKNSDFKKAGEQLARQVESGRGLAEAMSLVPLFPLGFSHLVKWAEKPGSLPDVLHMMGDMFEARAKSRLTFVGAIVGLFSIVFILWGVFVVVLGLFTPMVSLISRLSG